MGLKDAEISGIRADVKELRGSLASLVGEVKAIKVEVRIHSVLLLAIAMRLFFPGLFQ